MTSTFLQIFSLSLTLVASIFLLKGNLGLSTKNIVELSRPRYGFNINIIKSLSKQNSDTWIGVIILLISFILQIVIVNSPLKIDGPDVKSRSTLLAIILAAIIFVVSWFTSYFMCKIKVRSAQKLLNEDDA